MIVRIRGIFVLIFFVIVYWMWRLIWGVELLFGYRLEDKGWRLVIFKSVVREIKLLCF